MDCVILAAGYATRLYPLTLNFPKALLDVGGKPIMTRIVEKIALLKDLKNIYIVTNHKFYQNFVEWKNNSFFRINVEIVDDGTLSNDDRLGAIGDLNFVKTKKDISGDTLVIAGDNLFDFDMVKFIDFAKSKKPAASLIAYDVKNIEDAKRYGVVLIDEAKKVILFEEKPKEPKSSLIGTGIYFLPDDAIKRIQEYLDCCSKKSDAIGFYLKWLSENHGVYGHDFGGDWFDIGDIEVYNKVKEKYKEK